MKELSLIGGLLLVASFFVSGVIFGFSYSPFNRSLVGILKNAWTIIAVIGLIELNRDILLNTSKKWSNWVLITLFLTLVTTSVSLNDLSSAHNILLFLSREFIPAVIKNTFLSYLVLKDGYKAAMLYVLPFEILTIVFPVLPKNFLIVKAFLNTIIPLFLFVRLEKYTQDRKFYYQIREKKYIKPILKHGLYLSILAVIGLFATGYFKYKPVIILSDSMHPVFSRGDVVIIKKASCNEVALNDIIEYDLNKVKIVHRIVASEGLGYRLKGDNNQSNDPKIVTKDQVTGKVMFSIPKIGHPTLFFRNLFNVKEKDTDIERGE